MVFITNAPTSTLIHLYSLYCWQVLQPLLEDSFNADALNYHNFTQHDYVLLCTEIFRFELHEKQVL